MEPRAGRLRKLFQGRAGRIRLIVWGSFWTILLSFYYWQPIRIEFFPPAVPAHAELDPDSERFFSEGARVLVVAAHPDDAEFFIGGTLLQLGRAGAQVRLVAMTNGDKAFYPWGADPELTRTRQSEQRNAAQIWGGTVQFLGYKDARLPVNDKTVGDLVAIMEQFDPEYVLSFDPVYRARRDHSDHIDTGRNVLRALERWGGDSWVLLFSTRAPNYFVDISGDWFDKRDLLAVHASQFSAERLERVANFVASRAEQYGDQAGVGMAEGFRCYRTTDRK